MFSYKIKKRDSLPLISYLIYNNIYRALTSLKVQNRRKNFKKKTQH